VMRFRRVGNLLPTALLAVFVRNFLHTVNPFVNVGNKLPTLRFGAFTQYAVYWCMTLDRAWLAMQKRLTGHQGLANM
jgi:hypothetical protein